MTRAARRPRGGRAALALLLAGAGGCATDPVDVASTGESALLAIHAAFEDAVDRAQDDSDLHWHSGPVGNAWINFWRANNRGLCYHWQGYTYDQVVSTVERVGWEATGITINLTTPNEHHSVLVWDPERITREEIDAALPVARPDAPTYVLDAWRYGRADIWHLRDWLAIPLRVRRPAELEELPYVEEDEPAP